ncbi:hypothetical protein [Rhizorhapis sp. SPR117]|uniref:hypothetical protein n=1 Tax=Rhizorhapis sp. SPR117 TaxID=2912611 RepID=UPI001F2ED1F7|nr:hypothetical protein [Rhizorhapis sp. SPR117]
MRGQESRHRRIVPPRPAVQAGANGTLSPDDWTVLHDLHADDPITDEELAVIEAFLMPALQALFEAENTSHDSKEPQRFGKVADRIVAADDRP